MNARIHETIRIITADCTSRVKQGQTLLKLLTKLSKLLADPVSEAFELEKLTEKLHELRAEVQDDRLDGLLTAIHEALPTWKQEKILVFSKLLVAEFGEEGYELSVRGSEYRVGGFVIRADLTGGIAAIEFARERIRDKIPLKPKLLVKAFKSSYKEVCQRKLEPKEFLTVLYQAYTRTLFTVGQQLGSRVNVIDMLAETAFLLQKTGFRQDPDKKNYRAYGRAMFSHDLNMLRQSNQFVIQGRRLNIGTATIDFAEDRRKALYLTDGLGGGNFIMYLAFIPAGE